MVDKKLKKLLKLKMSYHLAKGIASEKKTYGNNTSYVKKVQQMLDDEYESFYEAEEKANKLGLGRTILYGDMGLIVDK